MPVIAAEQQVIATAPIHVAVGVIRGPDNTVLAALRASHSHQGGLWEFPGGKLEPGENVNQALQRELEEELGITVLAQSRLCRIAHDYADKSVLLDVWSVDKFSGCPHGQQGQPLRWIPVEQLQMDEFPVANRAIIRRLQLPEMIAITGDCEDAETFFSRFEQVLAQGINMVQLRAPALSEYEFRIRAQRCVELCQVYNARLLLNAEPELVAEVDAAGFHASSDRLMALTQRPVDERSYFSASCHDLEQLHHAEKLGADFVFLSPVLATGSHPKALPLGWEQFKKLAAAVAVPCYALGGLSPLDVSVSRINGGAGIAAISAFW
jgi:8-oxo-dGTP diphosphatase